MTASIESILQVELQSLYRIDGCPPVDPFRVRAPEHGREALLVRHAEDGVVDLGLHLAPEVRASAEAALVSREVDLDGLCAAIEGVSHFVYFTRWTEHRPMSRLELELQAEIDKFLVLWSSLDGRALFLRLFEEVRLADEDRYRVAHREGRRYASWLLRQRQAGRTAEALEDARRLYRSPLPQKLDRIARAA
ncbi:MAG: hypothetical protein AAGD10_00720 [Myxococcota bacterium]